MQNILTGTVLFMLIPGIIFSQIQITNSANSRFEDRIRTVVNNIWIIDTHEHLMTEEERIEKAEQMDFTYLFSHYAKEDLISASNDKSIIEIIFGHDFSIDDRWQLFKPFYETMRSTGYGRVPLIIANDLFGITDINDKTYAELSEKVKEASKNGWYKYVLKDCAKIELSIQDGGHRKFDKEFYRHVERFDHFIQVSSISEIQQIGRQNDIQIKTIDDFLSALCKAFKEGIEYGMVGVKSALAYKRILKYENVSEEKARLIFDNMFSNDGSMTKPTTQDIKALQDYMMHRVLDLANEFKMPVQIHTGLQAGNGNVITNSNPTHLVNLFFEYPDVNFCIFHSSYPYGGELSTLAKNFPNVFIDMCWTYIISPSFSERYLHEWIETVPSNKILGFGGDYSIVEAVYAHSVMARKVVSKVLIEKVRSGYLTESEAIYIANRILRDNAMELFRLGGKSHSVENLEVLKKPGRLRDWWKIHKSKSGFIRNWMVIGPFDYGTGLDEIHPPEQELKFFKDYPVLDGKISWAKEVTPESGYLNLVAVFNQRREDSGTDLRAMAYAYTEVESPENRKVTLTLGSNDGAKLWLNGEVIYNVHVGRVAVADQVFLEVYFKKGKNKILAKVENWGANWGLYLRVVDPNQELTIETFDKE